MKGKQEKKKRRKNIKKKTKKTNIDKLILLQHFQIKKVLNNSPSYYIYISIFKLVSIYITSSKLR